MLVVVEGPDGSGKSTLIDRLRKNSTNYFLIVRSSGPPGSLSDTEKYLRGVAAFAQCVEPTAVVCDRFQPISETIYGTIVRRQYSNLEFVDYPEVDRYIYCRPSYETISKNVFLTRQMAGVDRHIAEIVMAYDRLFAWLSGKREVYQYNYEAVRSEELLYENIFR